MTSLYFDHALLPDGWARNVCIDVDGRGTISAVTTNVENAAADHQGRIAVAGMPNIHSHAFQRAMAGLAETRGDSEDSFWTWRQIMYRFLEHLTPSDLAAIARQLYVEMLEAGFTSIAEFHYLHHDPEGRPYDDIGAMSASLAEAAAETGIGMTFLPVFYANGGFDGAPATAEQRRFINSPEQFANLVDRVRNIAGNLEDAVVGIAPHSLRAVTPESLSEILNLAGDGPIHIHIAEQLAEVEACIAWSGARPVQWLMDNVGVDEQWCLIHATHMADSERVSVATSGAVVGLCPITEANLGDGIFDAQAYMKEGGRFAIGSDSNIYIGVAEELRLLEYSQRLRDRSRNRLTASGSSTGRSLYDQALLGGEMGSGRKIGRLATGYRADIVSLDGDHPAMICRHGDGWLDGWLFAGDNRVVVDVWTGGRQVVAGGRHHARQAAIQSFRTTLTQILEK